MWKIKYKIIKYNLDKYVYVYTYVHTYPYVIKYTIYIAKLFYTPSTVIK